MLNLPKHQTLDTHAQNTAIHHLRMQVRELGEREMKAVMEWEMRGE
jgi:hypothetical protein